MNFTGGRLFLAKWPRIGLVSSRLLHELDQADLRRFVAVAGRSLVLSDHARAGLQHSRRANLALRIEQLRHADFLSENPCYLSISFSVPSVARYLAGLLARALFYRYRLTGLTLPPFGLVAEPSQSLSLLVLFPERLDLHIHTGRQIELHQRVDRLLASVRECRAGACVSGSRTARAISCPRAANATRSTCSSSWAMESAPRSARRCASPSRRSHPWTGPGCGSRRLSAGCEFFLFQSRFHSLAPPGSPGGKNWRQVASRVVYVARAPSPEAVACKPSAELRSAWTAEALSNVTSQSPQSCPRPPCGRLRESRTATPSPSRPA